MCPRGRQADEEMRRTVLFSLPAEMETGRKKERRRRKEREKKKCGGESFVSITLTEMESYYRYSQCCQRLCSEFLRRRLCVSELHPWRSRCAGTC